MLRQLLVKEVIISYPFNVAFVGSLLNYILIGAAAVDLKLVYCSMVVKATYNFIIMYLFVCYTCTLFLYE
jgi:hypothetical protein